MPRGILAAALLLLLPACASGVHTPHLPLAPEVHQRINREAGHGRSVVELEDTVLVHPAGLRFTADSLGWIGGDVERRAPLSVLRCIRITAPRPSYAERLLWGAIATAAAATAMTGYFGLIEEGGGAPGFVGGLMINTVIVSPLAFPIGYALAPAPTRTYRFPAAAAGPTGGCAPPPR